MLYEYAIEPEAIGSTGVPSSLGSVDPAAKR